MKPTSITKLIILILLIIVLMILCNSSVDTFADDGLVVQLRIDGNDFLNGIRFVQDDDQGDAEIYIDPASGAMFIEASGGVYINGKKYD